MPLQMQRLLKEMRQIDNVDFAEPEIEPGVEELYVTQVPEPIRRMAAVMQLRMEELRKEVFYFVNNVSSAPEDTIDRLRRYVDFIAAMIMHETEELVPEVADLKRKGALIVFRKKWTVYAVENAMKPDAGIPTDVIAELVAEQILDDINNEDGQKPPPNQHENDGQQDDLPDNSDDALGGWSDDGDIGYLMEKAGWFDTAAGIAQRSRGNVNDSDDSDDDDKWN